MIRVGVTGGIGSGKTTFCKKWEELGAFVVYADDLAKDLMVSNTKLISSIKQVFGEKAYFKNGSLNRAYLANEAFEKGKVEELNAIVHPTLWTEIEKLAQSKEKKGVSLFVKEAALLLKNGRPKDVDIVILLLASKEIRINRTVKRDNLEPNLVISRITKQQEFETLQHLADYVVENDGTIESLNNKAIALFESISSKKL